MKKKLSLFLIMIFVVFSAAFAQELPRIAVYVTGEIGDNEKKAFAARMLVSLINTGRYVMGEERPNSFFAEVEKGHGGEINDSQISELAGRFGINHICIIDVSPLFDGYQILARIVDAENVDVVRIGDSYSPLKTADDLVQASDDLVKAMSRGRIARPEPKSEPVLQPAPVPEPESESAPVAFAPSVAPEPAPVRSAPAVAVAPAPVPPSAPVAVAPTPPVAAKSKWPPRAAVYITGLNPMLGNALSRAVTSALMKANVYEGIESIDKHVTGTPNDKHIIEAGKKAGVDFVFVINVSGQVNVRIIDVDLETVPANISLDGKMNSPLDAGKMAASIVNFILKSGPKPPPGYTPPAAQAPVSTASGGRTNAQSGGGRFDVEDAGHSDSKRHKFSLGVSAGTAAIEPHMRLGMGAHSRLYFGCGLYNRGGNKETHIASFLELHTNGVLSVYGGPGFMVGFYDYEYYEKDSGFILGIQSGLELRLGWFLLGTDGRFGFYWRRWDNNGGIRSIGVRTGIAF